MRSGNVDVSVPINAKPDSFFMVDDESDFTVPSPAWVVSSDPNSGSTTLRIPVRAVPALGYKTIWLHPLHPEGGKLPFSLGETEKPTQFELENDHIHVVVSKETGCITSLLDKKTGFESIAQGGCGNELQAFKDTPKQYDAWNIDPGTLDQQPSLISKVDSVELVTTSTRHQAVRITRTWQSSKFVQTISISHDGDQTDRDIVDIDNDIDWHEKHVLLKAAFPLDITSDFATYEIPYGTIERPTTRNNSWEKAQFEVPAMRWADLSGAGPDGKVHGLSVLNQDKYGYDAVGNVLRLTLLRSPTWPDPDADQGHHHFHYALYPHAGTWKDALTLRHGWEYDYPLQAVVTTAHAGSLPPEHSFASVKPDNVVLTAVKKAEDANGLIFRVYEWAGKESTTEFHVPAGATSATVTNLMEQPEGDPLAVAGDVVKVPIHPYEILTIRVDYPKQ